MALVNFATIPMGASASDTGHVAGHPGSALIDGDIDTWWGVSAYGQTTEVDLGQQRTVSRFRWINNDPSNYAGQFLFTYSVDQLSWTQLGDWNALAGANQWDFDPVALRFFRMSVYGGGAGSVRGYEVEILGEEQTTPPELPPEVPEGGIKAWLTYLDDTYVADAQEWLDENL